MDEHGDATIVDPNRWQRLTLALSFDQNGNPLPSTQNPVGHDWGRVTPFALSDTALTIHTRNNKDFYVYHDPGPFALIDTLTGGGNSDEYKWNFELVSAWSSHLDPTDGVMWDISPRSNGNNQSYPKNLTELHDFYDFVNGGDHSPGRLMNPKTGQPYAEQVVPRGDYTRVLSQFWADGPSSETPPGHWFVILNQVMDHPDFVRKFNGKGDVLDPLQYDVKAYFTLGGAVHDAAVTAWGIKGWYDGVRPVSALRYMAGQGQSSDSTLSHYDVAGLQLIPGLVEQVQAGDPLAGFSGKNIGKIKIKAWRGPNAVSDPVNQFAGVDWILAEDWWPYQRKTFVTPPFAGYISGHSTYSRAAAEVLTQITGDEYFPGGLGEFHIAANSNFLGLEKGPSMDVTLQWATYRDASDQTSLSRIWGGIHPPMDDIPGRLIGAEIGNDAFAKARRYFYKDEDHDGFFSYEDCDDHDATVYTGAPELCDGRDNNCDGLIDENLPVFTYYVDNDGDGFGSKEMAMTVCQTAAPIGFVANSLDCNDNDPAVNPDAAELCDNKDNNCNGSIDDNLPQFTYYVDADGDGFGTEASGMTTCQSAAPVGFVDNKLDCDDTDAAINPNAVELCDNKDNNCNGSIDDNLPVFTYYVDADGDGFGSDVSAVTTCQTTTPLGFVANKLDCNDADAAINPNAVELCDNKDNDCNGSVDDNLPLKTYFADADGDGYGNPATATTTCQTTTPVGYVTNGQDCDDTNSQINPAKAEVCDGVDNNCNGMIDDGLPIHTYYRDADGDGEGSAVVLQSTCEATAPIGFVTNSLDCDDHNAAINTQTAEICDGLDNNCNGQIDEGLTIHSFYADMDGDGFGDPAMRLDDCIATAPSGYVTNSTDCNDNNAAVNPNAIEVQDGIDNNCNGLVDETSGTTDLSNKTLVYPNPVQDQLVIYHEAGGELTAQLVNTAGQIVINRNLTVNGDHITTLDCSGMLPGVYFLRLQGLGNGKDLLVKVVKM
ncbi:MAG: MopE-related protein, partial [Bacteroidota bacterium]